MAERCKPGATTEWHSYDKVPVCVAKKLGCAKLCALMHLNVMDFRANTDFYSRHL